MKRNLIPTLKFGEFEFCEHCIYGKQNRRVFKDEKHTSKDTLNYIHLVVWPSPVPSYGGALYFVSFIDDFSRKVWTKNLESESDVFLAFQNFIE